MGKSKIIVYLLGLPVVLLAFLNLCLVFTPEIGFDALWYHLTLPKLWLLKKQYFFPGGLLYYSVMPRLTEMLFIPLIHFTGTIGPKLLQFLSGLGISYYLWLITKKLNFKVVYQIIAVSLFYCTWLVSWESSSAYIDLFRSFLETVALFYFLNKKWFVGGILLGLALGTKWLVLFSCLIYALVFGWRILLPIGLVSFPWFLISYFYTGNPIYPLFSPLIQNGFQSWWGIVKNFALAPLLFTFPFDDFISPLVGIIFSLSFLGLFLLKGDHRKISLIGILGALSTLILSPPSARFLIPFLPALIVSALLIYQKLPQKLESVIILFTLLSSLIILGLRLFAFQKYLPFLSRQQTRNDFLTSMSPRLPDTFIDSDDYVKNLPSNSSFLIDKLHNLYYFPRDFDHTSWANPNQKYDYLISQNEDTKTVTGKLIHTNQIGIQIFKLND